MKSVKIFWSCLTVMVMLAAMLMLGGCGTEQGQGTSAGTSSSSTQKVEDKHPGKPAKPDTKPAEPKEQQINIKVYYPDDQGMSLVAVTRQIKVEDPQDKYTAAMVSLMNGTKDKGCTVVIPKQTKLKSVRVEDGLATVDFDSNMVKHFVGGSTGEEMMIGSIVNTLTEFPEVKKVRVLIEGQPVETIAGHMDLSEPLERMKDIIKS